LSIIDVENRDIHSGSIRVTAEKSGKVSEKVSEIIESERDTICDVNYLDIFQKLVNKHIEDFKDEIKKSKDKGLKICGYGASGRANMFCNITNIDDTIIDFIVDESPERCGRYIANKNIPIVDVETLKNSEVDLLIIFAWNYSKMIMEKTKYKKYNYMVAFPKIQYINEYDTEKIKFKSI